MTAKATKAAKATATKTARATRAKTAQATRRAHVRSTLATRKERCDDDCPGWLPGDHGIERCDECAGLNGYGNDITDQDLGALPEVRLAARRIYAAQDEYSRRHGG
jgi:hypothetical protein